MSVNESSRVHAFANASSNALSTVHSSNEASHHANRSVNESDNTLRNLTDPPYMNVIHGHSFFSDVLQEFDSLPETQGLGGPRRKAARSIHFRRAIDKITGVNQQGATDFDALQKLCNDISLAGPFSTIEQCQESLKHCYVNIDEYLNALYNGRRPRVYDDRRSFIASTRERHFTLELVRPNIVLRALLKNVAD